MFFQQKKKSHSKSHSGEDKIITCIPRKKKSLQKSLRWIHPTQLAKSKKFFFHLTNKNIACILSKKKVTPKVTPVDPPYTARKIQKFI